jgi:predicted esterase
VFSFYFLSSEAQQKQVINERPFPKPDGPYQVGTTNYFWIDEMRDEIFTKDKADKRHLLVQVWYPAQINHSEYFSPYILNPQEFDQPTQQIKDMFLVKTNAILDAPIASNKKIFPVILFSHGMGMPRFSSTFLMEHLASHGFIIFGIGHSFFDGTVVFPDGYRPEQNFYPELVQSKSQDDSDKNHIHFILEAFQKDTEFILTQIERLNETQGERFYDKLDLSRIGICGWSIGGINAAQMCKKNIRILAGINFDGLAGGDVVKDGIEKPFMVMKSGADIPENMLSCENSFLRNSTNDIYRITISGAVHTNFSDMGLFNSIMEGKIDTKYCFDIINHITLAFFRKNIKINKKVDIEKVAKQYPEVKFEKF